MAFGVDSKLGELLDDPRAKEILLKHMPEIKNAGPMLMMGKGMSLKTIAGFPQANLSADKLQLIDQELKTL